MGRPGSGYPDEFPLVRTSDVERASSAETDRFDEQSGFTVQVDDPRRVTTAR